MPDVVMHKINGYLVSETSANALADGIAWMLSKDADLLVLASNARAFALEHYQDIKVGSQYKALYEDL